MKKLALVVQKLENTAFVAKAKRKSSKRKVSGSRPRTMAAQALLQGKRGLVVGVSNARSLGWAVAKSWAQHGASVSVAVESERFLDKVQRLVDKEMPKDAAVDVLQCNVDDDASLEACRDAVSRSGLDMACHAVAYAPREALHGRFVDVTREDFARTMGTSVYSFIALARALEPVLKRSESEESTSLMTLTFDGSQRAVPGYGIMGPAKGALEASCRYLAGDLGMRSNIRVNAISAGPVNTLAARGLPGFHNLRDRAVAARALPDVFTADDVGRVASFLGSDLAAHVSGQTLFVDSGISSQAFGRDENPAQG